MSTIEITYKINNTFINKFTEDFEEYISYENIEQKFYEEIKKNEKFLDENNLSAEQKDISIEYIRYFNNDYEGWLLLGKNDYIGLDINKILIIANIKTYNAKDLIESYLETKKRVEVLSEEIHTKIDNAIDSDHALNSEIDISILIANPLIDIQIDDKNEIKKELKSMNDFNNIANSIFNVIIDSTKLINAEFYPLTEYNLRKAISHKPKILHIICKSTYILPEKEKIKENDESFNFVNLIFEDDYYCKMRKINQKDLDNILEDESIKQLIANTFLIISTQLSFDIYKIIEKYNFQNILVQHTTVADSSFIADFNEQFYKNIIENNDNNIYDYYEDALNIYFNESNQFCCCFHQHKNDCSFMKNNNKELYYNYEDINENSFIISSSHFSHLRYKCDCNCKMLDFCVHMKIKNCDNNLNGEPNKKKSICCCPKFKKEKIINKIQHSISNIFYHNFNKNCNIKLGDGINGFGVIKNPEIVPNYEKMKFITGRNIIVYEVYENIFNLNSEIINIYNNGKPNELIQLADIIIEYLKERIYDENDGNNYINCSLSGNLEMKKGKTFQNMTPSINDDSLDFTTVKSAPLQSKVKLKYNFIKNILKNNEELNTFKLKEKTIYFLIVLDDNLINDLFYKKGKYLKNPNIKVILFANNLIEYKENENIDKFIIKNLEMRHLKFEDYQIQYQAEKIKKNKNDFDDYIQKEMIGNKDIKIIEINNESKYEIIFLFYCIQLEIYRCDLEVMFSDNFKYIENLIEKYINIIITKEEEIYKKIYKKININKYFDSYYENCKNNIDDKIKQKIILKFFEFFSIVFRYLIEQI